MNFISFDRYYHQGWSWLLKVLWWKQCWSSLWWWFHFLFSPIFSAKHSSMKVYKVGPKYFNNYYYHCHIIVILTMILLFTTNDKGEHGDESTQKPNILISLFCSRLSITQWESSLNSPTCIFLTLGIYFFVHLCIHVDANCFKIMIF